MMVSRLAGLLLASVIAVSPAWAQEAVTLHFWVAWDPAQSDGIAAQKQIAQYEQAHPGIKIDIQNITFDALHDKLVTAVAGGQGPDISWGLPEWLGELDRMGALMDLTAWSKTWSGREAMYPNALQALTVDGRLMALPHYLGIRALLVHQDMLKQAGIATPPASWAELIADAQAIKQKTGQYGFGIAGTGVRSPQELIMYLAQNNVVLAKPTKDGKFRNTWGEEPAELQRAAAVFAFYRDLADKEAMAPEASSWGWEQEDTNFALGRYAMVVNGAWMQSRETQNPKEMADVAISAPPTVAKSATFFEVNPFYVMKATQHPTETLAFVDFLTSHEYNLAVRPQNSARQDVTSDTKWGRDFTKLAPIGVVFPAVPLGGITRDMQVSIGRVLLRHEEPESVAKWLGTAINRNLRQAGVLGSEG